MIAGEFADADLEERWAATCPGGCCELDPGVWLMHRERRMESRLHAISMDRVGTNHSLLEVVDVHAGTPSWSDVDAAIGGWSLLEHWSDGEGHCWRRWVKRRTWVTSP